MKAWCSALGKPLLCLIAEEGKPDNPAGYLFPDDEQPGSLVELAKQENGFVVAEQQSATEGGDR
jgi:hypothetical protein